MITSQSRNSRRNAGAGALPPVFARYQAPIRAVPLGFHGRQSDDAFCAPKADVSLVLPAAADLTVSRHETRQGEIAKRGFDILFSVIMLVLFAPLLVVLCLVVRLSSPGPAVFRQTRVGRDGKLFPCLKLRTMLVDAEARLQDLLASDPAARAEWDRDQKLRSDPRITKIGLFLRKSSLDEIPQLWNVLVGDMSVVGPRPIVEGEVFRYREFISDYYAVRPGLTGPWQIGGRNDVTYDERVALDSRYARSRSFSGDLVICFKTVPAMMQSRGCY